MGKALDTFAIIMAVIVVAVVFFILMGWIFMFAWNNAIATTFKIKTIDIWQSFCFLILLSFLKIGTTKTIDLNDIYTKKEEKKVEEFKLEKP